MTTPRLLLVTTVPGTIRQFLVPYVRHFRSLGWEVDAASSDPNDADRELLVAELDHLWRVPWRREPADRHNWTTAPRVLRALLRARRYDLVHTHTPVASFVTRLVVGTLPPEERPAVVYTAHGFHFHPGGRPAANLAFRAAERLAGRWTDRLVVINRNDLEQAERHRLVLPGRVAYLPGVGIDLEHYRPTPALLDEAAAFRADLGLQPGTPLFSVVAELNPGKGHLTAVRALAAAQELGAVLACAGGGPMRDAIAAEAGRLGVEDRVRLLGTLPEIRPLVLASRATVLASAREGLSRAVLESLALGVPVLGTRIRGIAELVGDDGGVLVEPGDVQGLADAMRAALSFPPPVELRERLEPRLRGYAVEELLRRHEQLYGEVLGRPVRTAGEHEDPRGGGAGVRPLLARRSSSGR